jgi:hypothetical protein
MGSSVPPVKVRFQAEGQEQVTAAFRNVASQGTAVNRTFVEGSGRVSAFGRQSVQALNATGFAVSQLAATGTTGFKSLASSAAGFASFFGVGGLIASGVISLGLILTDFWNRQRREIEETKRKAEAELTSLKQRFEQAEDTRAREADPVGTAQKELQRVAQRSVENQRRMAEIDADPEGRKAVPAATPIARARITESRAALRAQLAKQVQEDAKAVMGASNAVVDAQKKVAAAAGNATTETAKGTKATSDSADAARLAERALEAEIDALVQLGRQGQLSVADMARLIDLQEQFTKAVRDGTLSLEQRAAASKRLSETDRGLVIPEVKVGDITETRTSKAPGPAVTIPAPKIPPADVQAAVAPAAAGFGEAFSQSLQSSLAAGVTSFIASGSIEGLWNSVGGSIVAGISVVNPWLGMAAGILQGLIGGLLGGNDKGSNRMRPLPVDIRRVINDPNAKAPRFNTANQRPLNVIGINSARGQRLVGTSNRNFGRRGGR